MVSIITPDDINMQGHLGVVNEALKKFTKQVYIKITNARPWKFNTIFQTRTTGKIDDHTGQGFIQWHIGMTITTKSRLIAHRLGKRLTTVMPTSSTV